MRRQMYCFCRSALLKMDGGRTMHCEIVTLKRTISALVLSLGLLLGMGMTSQAQQDKKAIKSEQKLEKSALKTHQREERVALKNRQREERETDKESSRSQHKRWKIWKRDRPHPNPDHNARKRCLKGCKEAHKSALRACRGRIGADRRACERAANQSHRSCQASCPR
jgi:hypothetical protein